MIVCICKTTIGLKKRKNPLLLFFTCGGFCKPTRIEWTYVHPGPATSAVFLRNAFLLCRLDQIIVVKSTVHRDQAFYGKTQGQAKVLIIEGLGKKKSSDLTQARE